MSNNFTQLIQKHWNYCNILRDDGLSYGDYVEQSWRLFNKAVTNHNGIGAAVERGRRTGVGGVDQPPLRRTFAAGNLQKAFKGKLV